MAHGDVLIAKEEEPAAPDRNGPKVVASMATESFVSKQAEGDIIQQNDPWAKAAAKLSAKPTTFQIGNPLEDMTQKVIAEVMSKLPQPTMEVDSDAGADKRVTALETQVEDLHGQTQALAKQVQQHAHDTAGHFQDVQAQLHQQSTHFENAIAAQASSLHGFQESFQEQFRQQVSHQQTMLDSMFTKQMSQFEALLAKRPRQE